MPGGWLARRVRALLAWDTSGTDRSDRMDRSTAVPAEGNGSPCGSTAVSCTGGSSWSPWAASSWSSTSRAIAPAVIVDVLRLWPLALVAIGLGLVLRRTRFSVPGGMLAAAAPGLLLGAGLAVAPRIAIDCGVATAAPTIAQHQGQFDGPARVTVATGCGELVVGTAPGAGWQFDAGSIADRTPIVDASSRSLAISAGGDHGWYFAFDSDGIDRGDPFGRTRDTWHLTLPTTDIEDLSVEGERRARPDRPAGCPDRQPGPHDQRRHDVGRPDRDVGGDPVGHGERRDCWPSACQRGRTSSAR